MRPPDDMTYWQVVVEYIFKNPYMWIISFANLSVYVLRYAQMTWGPTFLQEYKDFSVVAAGWLYFGAEIGGMVGALVAGFVADRVFHGRAGRVCVIAMAADGRRDLPVLDRPASSRFVSGVLYVVMGFLLYVPQMLIAAMAMNLGTKRASAAAVGLTGIIGYGSTIITGWGIGSLVDNHGWPAAFKLMLGCAGDHARADGVHVERRRPHAEPSPRIDLLQALPIFILFDESPSSARYAREGIKRETRFVRFSQITTISGDTLIKTGRSTGESGARQSPQLHPDRHRPAALRGRGRRQRSAGWRRRSSSACAQAAVKESIERVRRAIINSGYAVPAPRAADQPRAGRREEGGAGARPADRDRRAARRRTSSRPTGTRSSSSPASWRSTGACGRSRAACRWRCWRSRRSSAA